MLKGLIFMVVLFIAWIIAVFGFCQIVGSIKYRTPNWVFTVVLWGAILIGGIAITNAWLSSYKWATYLAYTIGFLLSLRVKPDNQ